MKFHKILICVFLTATLFAACGTVRKEEPDTASTAGEPAADTMYSRIVKRCAEITGLYRDLYNDGEKTAPQNPWGEPVLSRSSIEAIEALLIDAGLDVMDTDAVYPGYLSTGEKFREFWEDGTQQRQEVLTIRESGTLAYQLFVRESSGIYMYTMHYPMDGSEVCYYEVHKVQDWELTDRGHFYYRTYPAGDQHYADFSLIRLAAPDPELWDLNRKYLAAGGYIAANIFLTDWSETDFRSLSFNDLWEYLYFDRYGTHFRPNGYRYDPDRFCYQIPAAEFEAVVLPYFDVDMETFRNLAQYNEAENAYPWRPVETNDFLFLGYYDMEPEVTAYQVNPDSTITMTVEALSTDLKTDCLFSHTLTVRPMEDGGFQFVGNQVTYQTEYGLPFCQPRLTWRETR